MVVVADGENKTDGFARDYLQKVNTNIPIVLVAWTEYFEFNEELLSLKEYILVCYCEYGWDARMDETHIWGGNSEKFSRYYNGDWIRFDNWVKENPPKILFKRELLSKDRVDNIFPIDYPCDHEIPPPQTREQFDNRYFEVFFNWGLSHPSRPKLHGEIWAQSEEMGYAVCDNFFNVNKFIENDTTKRKWLTINTPWYQRFHMKDIIGVNGNSKLSVSWFGAGQKCFRSSESPINSVMIMPEDNLAWAFPWIHTENCLRIFHIEQPFWELEEATKRKDLYDIYLSGIENCKNYQVDNYIKNHIEKTIKEICG